MSKGRLSRNKGAKFEREVAIAFRKIFPEARRHLEFQVEEAAAGCDLVNTGPFKIQCKRFKGYAPLTAIDEVVCDEVFGDIPVLVTRGDDRRALAALPLDDFLALVRIAFGAK